MKAKVKNLCIVFLMAVVMLFGVLAFLPKTATLISSSAFISQAASICSKVFIFKSSIFSIVPPYFKIKKSLT